MYILALFYLFPGIHITLIEFLIAHGIGILIATMVMFAGLGAGVLWIPLLTFLHVKPSEAVTISLFTQIAGKGMGSFNYYRSGMIDMKIARYFIPYSFAGLVVGYVAGFFITKRYEKFLLYLFIAVAVSLLIQMLKSIGKEREEYTGPPDPDNLKKSRLIVVISSFFSGLLSIGNNDWLIPYMERNLKMTAGRAIATGLFIMFCCSVFFLFVYAVGVYAGIQAWPQSSPVLFATCSGVVVGGQIGTRLVKVQWLKDHQKHAFILMLGLSIIHLLW
jgi:uncharacterized membrane protein YfcA